MTVEIAKAIPSTLSTSFTEYIYDPEAVAYLPRNTKTISLPGSIDLSLVRAFPVNLQRLDTHLLPFSVVSILPPLLQELTAYRIDDVLTEEMIKALPQHLRLLDIQARGSPPLTSLKVFRSLPKSLEAFALGVESSFIYPSVPCPNKSSLYFPRHLRELKVLAPLEAIEGQWFENLPSMLRSLSFMAVSVSFAALSSLRIQSDLKVLEIIVIRSPSDDWTCFLENLPPRLKHLYFRTSDNVPTPLTNNSFLKLPKSIKSVTIPISPLLDETCLLSHLPFLASLDVGEGITPDWFVPNTPNWK
jgi:hypothetical protein